MPDQMPQAIIADLYAKGPGSNGARDPLDQRRTLGIKFIINGTMYGLVLGTDSLLELGIHLSKPNQHRVVHFTALIEGVPPEEL